MRDRLIELIKESKKHTKNASSDIERNMIFADYLLANGVIVLPCKVGDEVYFVRFDEDCEKFIDKGWVYAISQNKNTLWFSVRYLSGLRYDHTSSDFGKTVFLTREETEAKLKGGAE